MSMARGEISELRTVVLLRGDLLRRTLLVAISVLLILINVTGAPYYLAPLAVRVRHPFHQWLRPTGFIGQPLGFLAITLFLFLWLYPIRKKYTDRLAFTGKLSTWLSWHVAAGLLVPWIAATHAGWRFTGLIGLGYLAMFIVYLSGLVGRYLYTRIPRRIDGLEMSRDEATSERERLLFELTAETGLPPDEVRRLLAPGIEEGQRLGVIATVGRMIADDFARRRAARRLIARVARDGGLVSQDRQAMRHVLRLARREMALSQQVRMLDATQRLFGYWHAAHKPFAVTALLAVLAHVGVAVALGAWTPLR